MSDGYPIVIMQDRYTGAYSGGEWFAVWDGLVDADGGGTERRALWVLFDGPGGDDVEAMEFWENQPDWIAVGDTPDAAVAAVRARAA